MISIPFISVDELEVILKKHRIGTNRCGEWNPPSGANVFVKILYNGNELQNESDWVRLIYPDNIENPVDIFEREPEEIHGIDWIPCYYEELVAWAMHIQEIPHVEECFIGNIIF
jgi:hypothetical protein